MIRAILVGTKTQTRRLVNPGKYVLPTDIGPWVFAMDGGGFGGLSRETNGGVSVFPLPRSPYGVPGDRLWVREAWKTAQSLDDDDATSMAKQCVEEAGYESPWAPVEYSADGERRDWTGAFGETGRQRLARFMPRWLSRITLEVTGVRVERLKDISEDDARAEGCQDGANDPRALFEALWDSINGAKGPWASNPWTRVVSFRRLP
jgi:hypothetical protein